MHWARFLQDNGRWIGGGFLLFLVSSFGQTVFISLSAADVRNTYGLSHGSFGTLYMAATLCSALTLPRLGPLVDRHAPGRVVLFVLPMLALACGLMAASTHVAVLFVALYLLRLFGQGMASHVAFTAMGRWFTAQRGKAMSFATLGMNAGEALFPMAFVALSTFAGWRSAWWGCALVIVLLGLPSIHMLVRRDRPADVPASGARVAVARHWTRPEVVRDPLFYLLMLAMLPPALIGNTIFFHQVYLAELRGWPTGTFAAAFPLMAAVTVLSTLASGQLVDRLSATTLLPFYLLPMGVACILLGSVPSPWAAVAFMVLYGVSNGFSLSLFGALWPEVYGLRHLGAIRSLIVATLVFVAAAGPGVSGVLIDLGVHYPALVTVLGTYCLGVSLLMVPTSRRVRSRGMRSTLL